MQKILLAQKKANNKNPQFSPNQADIQLGQFYLLMSWLFLPSFIKIR